MTKICFTSTRNNIFNDKKAVHLLETNVFPAYIQSCRWFGGKAYQLKHVEVEHFMNVPMGIISTDMWILEVHYHDHTPEYYQIPIIFTEQKPDNEKSIICTCILENSDGFLTDAAYDQRFQQAIFENIACQKKIKQPTGNLQFIKGKGFAEGENYQSSTFPNLEQSNTSIIFNENYFFKLYRKLYRGNNPELEHLQFLTEHTTFDQIPQFAGSIIWNRKGIEPVTFGLLMQKVDAQKDSWSDTGDTLNDFLHSLPKKEFTVKEYVFERVELLAKRTAQMHLALASNKKIKDFAPEHFNTQYRNWFEHHCQTLLQQRLTLAIQNKHLLDPQGQELADFFIRKKDLIQFFFSLLKYRRIDSLRTRVHGDYHLGQVLWTGSDYIIIDFEGEPESTITERKFKHSPLKDVAGMIRSYHYAVCAKLYFSDEAKNIPPEKLLTITDRWYNLIKDIFLENYYQTIGKNNALYRSRAEINFLLLYHLLEKAIYELGYELNSRPDWVKIPLKGIQNVVRDIEKTIYE